MTRALVLAALLASACSPVGEVLVAGQVRERNTLGHGPVAIFRLRQDFNKYTWCEYQHQSFWFVGPPFSSGAESSTDIVGCGVRTKLWGP